MKVGVIGYYGYGNAGDEEILRGLRAFLEPHRVVPVPIGFPASGQSVARLNGFDFLVLGGGGLIQRGLIAPFDTFGQWADDLTTPLGVLGLGVERPASGIAQTIQALVEKSVFFVVRDPTSKELVGHSKVQVAPDLTFYQPMQPQRAERQRRQQKDCTCLVNLRPTHRKVAAWIASIDALPCKKRAVVLSAHPDYGERPILEQLDPSCPERYTPAIYAHGDMLIGTAFHSLVFAVQSGLPAIAINYSPKVLRLMHELDLREFLLAWDDWGKLAAAYEALWQRRHEISARMMAYTAAATAQLQQLRPEILALLEESVQARATVVQVGGGAETASVVVEGSSAGHEAIRRTIRSCLAQTHANTEVVCIASSEEADSLIAGWEGDKRIVLVSPSENSTSSLRKGLQAARGAYVTMVQAGGWFADDAIAALCNALHHDPSADGACADYFLTHNGIIERRVVAAGEHARRWGTRGTLCYLLKRDAADQLLSGDYVPDEEPFPRVTPSSPLTYLPDALLYVEASQSEILLFRSVIAFRLGQVALGQRLLAQALDTDPDRCRSQLADLADLLERTAYRAVAASDPTEFLELFFRHLPENGRHLSVLRRPLLSRIAMARFFSAYKQGTWDHVLNHARSGIKNDPSWLRNRGVWKAVLVAGRRQASRKGIGKPINFRSDNDDQRPL